jgi:hypothetical protein
MSCKKASVDPGLCPFKGELSVPCSGARARNQFSIVSVSTTGPRHLAKRWLSTQRLIVLLPVSFTYVFSYNIYP